MCYYNTVYVFIAGPKEIVAFWPKHSAAMTHLLGSGVIFQSYIVVVSAVVVLSTVSSHLDLSHTHSALRDLMRPEGGLEGWGVELHRQFPQGLMCFQRGHHLFFFFLSLSV